jgi:hypothetical protein
MHPQEVYSLLRLSDAGVHPEVLARVFGRDPRTVRAVLQQAGVQHLHGASLPADWRTGLAPATITAIRAYIAQLQGQEQASWQRLKRASIDHTASTYTFPSPAAYTAVLQLA